MVSPRPGRRPARDRHPPGRRGGRHRRQPREPGPLLLRQRHHGHPADGAGPRGRASRSSSRSAPSAPTRSSRRCPSGRTISGTATPRRPTRPTASPRRCCWCRARPTAQQYGFNVIYLLPVNLYGPRRQLRPGQLARHPGADQEVRRRAGARRDSHRGLGQRLARRREFLYVEDAAEGIVLATERYDGAGPGEPRRRPRDHDPRPRAARSPPHRVRGRDPLGSVQAGRPAAPHPRHQPGQKAFRLRQPNPIRGGPAPNDRLVRGGSADGAGALVGQGTVLHLHGVLPLRSVHAVRALEVVEQPDVSGRNGRKSYGSTRSSGKSSRVPAALPDIVIEVSRPATSTWPAWLPSARPPSTSPMAARQRASSTPS